MDSPLGPFLANVFMGKFEMTSLQDTINDLSFYGRYVDDIFCLADSTTDIDDLVQKFNSAHPSLKLTAESEATNEIAFLDVLLHRQEDGSIQRRVFRKKTWTGQCINFHSIDPLNIKRNLVQELAARVRRICSPETIEAELQQLQNTHRENGYPDRPTPTDTSNGRGSGYTAGESGAMLPENPDTSAFSTVAKANLT
nr:unnamed protein product [Spirometra erinaceieuropaei]